MAEKKILFNIQEKGAQKVKGAMGGVTSSIKSMVMAGASIYTVKKAFDAMVGSAQRLEKGMAEVGTLTNMSTAGINEYKDAIVDLSKRVPESAENLTSALYETVSAGVALGDSMQFVETASKAGIAGVSDTKTAVDAMTSVMNAYKMSADSAERISDTLFTTVKRGKLHFDDIATTLGMVIPVASSFGVSFNEVAASYATLTKNGMLATRVSTSLGAAITEMVTPGMKASEAIKALGYESGEAALEEKTLQEISAELYDAGYNLSEIFGREAARAVLILGQNAATAASDLQGMESAAGATEEAYKRMSETFDAQVTLFKNSAMAIAESFGSQMLPALNAVLGGVKDLISPQMELVTNFEKISAKTSQLQGDFDSLTSTLLILSKRQELSNAELKIREETIAKLQSTFPNYFKNLEAEAGNFDDLSRSINKARQKLSEYTNQLLQRALVEQYSGRIAELTSQMVQNELAIARNDLEMEKLIESHRAEKWQIDQLKTSTEFLTTANEGFESELQAVRTELGLAQEKAQKYIEALAPSDVDETTESIREQVTAVKELSSGWYDSNLALAIWREEYANAITLIEDGGIKERIDEFMKANEGQINAMIGGINGATAAWKNHFETKKQHELADLRNTEKYLKADMETRASMEEKILQKYAERQKVLYRIQQASNLASVAMDTARAVMAVAPNPIAIAAMIALGATQIAAIASTPPPAYQEGGIIPGTSYTGDRQIARVNSGEMVLNKQQQANLFELANGRNVNNSNAVNINISGDFIGTPEMADKLAQLIYERSKDGFNKIAIT